MVYLGLPQYPLRFFSWRLQPTLTSAFLRIAPISSSLIIYASLSISVTLYRTHLARSNLSGNHALSLTLLGVLCCGEIMCEEEQ